MLHIEYLKSLSVCLDMPNIILLLWLQMRILLTDSSYKNNDCGHRVREVITKYAWLAEACLSTCPWGCLLTPRVTCYPD